MPSDPRLDPTAEALVGPLNVFRSALTEAVDQLRTDLSTLRDAEGARADDRSGLGPFARDRIDPALFATLLQQREPVDVDAGARIERAHDILSGVAAHEDSLWQISVDPGGDLREAVVRALDDIGRVFAAARLAELSRKGRFDEGRHGDLLGSVPFTQWTAGERALAPPLVVQVDGSDLRAAGLADFLEGDLKIVLLVRGAAPPAPLAGLISPGVLVSQSVNGESLDRLVLWPGPAVAALLPESAARFLHDPSAGDALSDRLTIEHLPDADPSEAIGGISIARQREDFLRQLAMLSAASEPAVPSPPPPPEPVPAATTAPAEPADRLAAWLLAQANLEEAP